jgi:hypothetical protein
MGIDELHEILGILVGQVRCGGVHNGGAECVGRASSVVPGIDVWSGFCFYRVLLLVVLVLVGG